MAESRGLGDVYKRQSKSKVITVSQVSNGPDYSAAKYNPLSYVAKYNSRRDGGWDTNYSTSGIPVLLDWHDAKGIFGYPRQISGASYQLPSVEAWRSIVSTDFKNGVNESVAVAGTEFNASSDYKSTTLTVNGESVKCHVALRFKGNGGTEKLYRSAWLYFNGTKSVNGMNVKGLWIYCINVASQTNISSVDQLDQKFWNENLTSAVSRFFPSLSRSKLPSFAGAVYWSSTLVESSSDQAYIFSFQLPNSIGISTRFIWDSHQNAPTAGVRLFADRPLD